MNLLQKIKHYMALRKQKPLKAYQDSWFDKAYTQAQTRMHVESNKLKAGHQETCSVGCMFDS